MNASDVMPAERATAQSESMVEDDVPYVSPVPRFSYSRVVEALAGSAPAYSGKCGDPGRFILEG
jgi:hypothetical protein